MAKEREGKGKSENINVRVPPELVRKAAAIREELAKDPEAEMTGQATLSSIYRVALARGLDSLAEETLKPHRR
jgi:ribosomal protein L11